MRCEHQNYIYSERNANVVFVNVMHAVHSREENHCSQKYELKMYSFKFKFLTCERANTGLTKLGKVLIASTNAH